MNTSTWQLSEGLVLTESLILDDISLDDTDVEVDTNNFLSPAATDVDLVVSEVAVINNSIDVSLQGTDNTTESKYFYKYSSLVDTDDSNEPEETNESNNVQSEAMTIQSPSVDLAVSKEVEASSKAVINNSINVSTVTNQSTDDTTPLVVTDDSNEPEQTDESNKVQSVAITIEAPAVDLVVLEVEAPSEAIQPPDVDLVISEVEAPSECLINSSIEVSWTVTNQGTDDATGFKNTWSWWDYWGNGGWSEGIYLSSDENFDLYNDTYLTSVWTNDYTPLVGGGSYTLNSSVYLPSYLNLSAGDYYLFVVTDSYNYQEETDESNNIQSVAITITAPEVDLVVSEVTAPTQAVIGNSIEVSWTVTNQGTDDATGYKSSWYGWDYWGNGGWSDGVYLSTDDHFDPYSDTYLTSVGTGDYTPLAGGGSYTLTNSVYLPSYLSAGDYYLFVVTDDYNSQGESDESNNVQSVAITISAPEVDLVVSEVTAPTQAVIGNSIEVSWTVTNQGSDDATGYTAFCDSMKYSNNNE